jgi:hypothetical protein
VEEYLEDMKKNSPSDLKEIAEEYMEATTELDDRTAELKKEIADLDKEISEERKTLRVNGGEVKYDFMKVTLGVFGEAEGEVELTLHYVVNHASWVPAYDIRFNTNSKEKRVSLVYKASITQSTGEVCSFHSFYFVHIHRCRLVVGRRPHHVAHIHSTRFILRI